MDIEALRTSTLAFVEAHKVWTPLIAGGLAFCESIAILSLFVPATVILIGIGALVGGADIPLWPVIGAAALGAALGDWLSYEAGRWVGPGARTKWPLRRYPDLVAKAERFIGRWGIAAVALGRFFGPARALVPLLAGTLGLARLPFQLANVASALVWAFVLLAPGAGLLAWLDR
ncbi:MULTISPECIES: DedA family protein [Methylobacterium]|uniref:DedA family protein n=1 Tax=Methylobacterium TaxID=407 RepID=UPI0011CA9A7D|nr:MULTISPECIES: DedA family protein [Methylobacterium]TXN65168.1 DedA family protein [Methylobacterium sp. WL18]GJE23344.1 Inner membrane protein YabI [Methylobacterium mesophilicum]